MLGGIEFRVDDGRRFVFGDEPAATVVELPAAEWDAFRDERWTRYGLLFHGHAVFTSGSFEDLCLWEPHLRARWHGRPVWDPATVDLPEHLDASFTLDDDTAAAFLQLAGYLHVAAVFDEAEVAALRDEVDALAAGSTLGDPTVWWTRGPDGDELVCQVKYGALRSDALARLHDDPRVRRILDFAGVDALRPLLDRNEGTKVIYKRPGASEGMTDLPWHTDCGMGYHPISCPMVLIGVHLDDGNEETGQLHALPGSHLATTPDPAIVDTSSWPAVALATRAGDCTVHFGHTLHAAPPPTGSARTGRRTFYLAFAPPTLFDALAPMEDLVANMQGEGGITKTVDDVLSG